MCNRNMLSMLQSEPLSMTHIWEDRRADEKKRKAVDPAPNPPTSPNLPNPPEKPCTLAPPLPPWVDEIAGLAREAREKKIFSVNLAGPPKRKGYTGRRILLTPQSLKQNCETLDSQAFVGAHRQALRAVAQGFNARRLQERRILLGSQP